MPEPLFDQTKEEHLHVIAAVSQAMSFHGACSREWSRLLGYISNKQYTPLDRKGMVSVARLLDGKIVAARTALLNERGPWSIAHDGASSGAHQMLNVFACNNRDEEVFLECMNADRAKKSKHLIAALLKKTLMPLAGRQRVADCY